MLSNLLSSNQSILANHDPFDRLFMDAIAEQASDIHIEAYEKEVYIRFRCDGLLRSYQELELDEGLRLVSRLKIMARLDISEKRKPQDGHIRWVDPSTSIPMDLRLSTLATLWGEKVVLRLLAKNHLLSVKHLGMTTEQLRIYSEALEAPQGLILISGPTGSGKSSSLYAALNLLNLPHYNICTAEDPIEVQIKGINQVNINETIGLGFAQLLRTFLRQDPDVLMVGEIRDKETAEMALNASQTGHLVLSTIHANDTFEVISRLQSMEINKYTILSSLSLIVTQRLLRKVCPHCSHYTSERENKEQIAYKIASPSGCSSCYQGYSGRTAIFSCLSKAELLNLKEKEGSHLMYQHSLEAHGLSLVKEGTTTLNELERVLGKLQLSHTIP